MKNINLIVSIIFIFLASCSKQNNDEKAAKQISFELYTYLNHGEIDSSLSLFSRDFYSKIPIDTLRTAFNTTKKSGGIVDVELLETTFDYNDGKKSITLAFKVSYVNGLIAKEKIIFFSDDRKKVVDGIDGYLKDYYQPPLSGVGVP